MDKQKALSDSFQRLIAALINWDDKELEKLILDDYRGFTLNGTIESKVDILKHFSSGGISLTEYFVENLEYVFSNSIGIITGKGRIAGNYKELNFSHEVLFTDVFKYVNNHWKYFKSQVTEIDPKS